MNTESIHNNVIPRKEQRQMPPINHAIRTNWFSKAFSLLAIRAVCLILLASSFARGNLVTNSDFLSYTGTAPKDFFLNVLPTDWNSGGYVFVDTPGSADNPSDPGIPVYPTFPTNAPLGGNFIEADGTPGLSLPLTQTINALNIGQNYTLTFYQAAGQQLGDAFAGGTTEQWQVTLGSNTQLSTLMSDPAGGVIPWQPQSMTFTASSTSEILSFVPIGGGLPPMVFLGNPDLEANVPEPSALMLLAGVGAVIAIGRVARRAIAKPSTR
jgi:hypothetical protein